MNVWIIKKKLYNLQVCLNHNSHKVITQKTKKRMNKKPIDILKLAELGTVIFIWLMVFIIPAFFGNQTETTDWESVFHYWKEVYPYFIIFVVNHFILIPYLLFKNKPLVYISSALLLIIAISIAYINSMPFNDKPFSNDKAFNEKPGFPPFDRPMEKDTSMAHLFNNKQFPREKFDDDFDPGPHKPIGFPRYLNLSLISLLMVGFNTGLRVAIKWTKTEQEKNLLEKENVKNQLAFLQHQVSPHFFMNTLNNIHSLIDIDSEEAKEAIIKLSKMMRYLLYDSNQKMVTIARELEFNKSYINLMKLRYSDKVKITLKQPNEFPDVLIHPMLFISLLENAFKHGISYKEPSFIDIEWAFTASSIMFEISNSKHSFQGTKEASGIGIENTRKRLELLYPEKHRLNIEETETVYKTTLIVFT